MITAFSETAEKEEGTYTVTKDGARGVTVQKVLCKLLANTSSLLYLILYYHT